LKGFLKTRTVKKDRHGGKFKKPQCFPLGRVNTCNIDSKIQNGLMIVLVCLVHIRLVSKWSS